MQSTTKAVFYAGMLLASPIHAQTTAETASKIDLYFSDWHAAAPTLTRGSLEQRTILTHGDGANPTQKGAVLRFLNSYTYATLPPKATTQSARLEGQQEIYFTASGQGTVTAKGQTADLRRNIAVLMPANLEFSIKNTSDEPLAMYILNEPTPLDSARTPPCWCGTKTRCPSPRAMNSGPTSSRPSLLPRTVSPPCRPC